MYAREVPTTIGAVEQEEIVCSKHTLSSITNALDNNIVHLEEMIDQLTNRLDTLIVHGPMPGPYVRESGDNSPAVNHLCDVNLKVLDIKEKLLYLLDKVQV